MISNLVALSAPFWQITKIKGAGAGGVGESDTVSAIVHFEKSLVAIHGLPVADAITFSRFANVGILKILELHQE
ncbi:hypothetical protein N9007_00590 [bacterium]|nr:hypothetical protein [bacterium]